MATNPITRVLDTLHIPRAAQRVYFALARRRKSSARGLADMLGMPRPSVYDHLAVLSRAGLVHEFEEGAKKMFQIADPEELEARIDDQMQLLLEGKRGLKKAVADLARTASAVEPRIRFYAGTDGYRQALTDVLMFPGVEACALWPYGEMTRVAGEAYLQTFTKRRVARGISLRTVWPAATTSRLGKLEKEEVRLAPKGMHWQMGYAIYDDRVSFISSREENFGFTVQSSDFSDLMRAQFELVWASSKKRPT